MTQRSYPGSSGLLPCPFCGGSNIKALSHLDWVACDDCGASLEDCEPSARDLWNKRAPQPVSIAKSAGMTLEKPDGWIVKNGHGGIELFLDHDRAIAALSAWGSWISPIYAGTIDWKMEAERANRLLTDAQRIIAEYKASTIAGAKADVAAHGLPGARGQRQQQDSDIGILLAVLRNFEDAVGEDIDDTEGVVAQIEADYLARVVADLEGSQLSSTDKTGAS